MGREYSAKRSSRQRGSAPQQFLVIIVSFLLGYFTASVFDVETISHWISTQVLAHQEVKKQPIKTETHQAQLPPKPKFEFYTLLANEKPGGATQSNVNAAANHAANLSAAGSSSKSDAVVAATNHPAGKPNTASSPQHAPVKVAEGKPLAPSQASTSKGSYLVQVAAFKARQDAEHMKGFLILKGFNVNVVLVTQAKGNWFRVVVGPYSNKVLAQKAQINLAKNERLNGMVISG
jgi:cell division protein FtsN